tara:strand:+ start:2237 stop:3364 length:1128 start_codon:yes stop_codon:yes gene_type:complete
MPKGIRRVSETSVEVSFTFNKKSYRERIKCNPDSDHDIAELTLWLDVLNLKIREGSFDYAEAFPNSHKRLEFLNPTITGDYLKGWLAQQKPRLKASTYGNYRKVIESQFPGIMPKLMVELKFKHIKEAASLLSVSQKTLNNYLSVLRKAFSDAEQDELIPDYRNPLHNRSIQLRTVRVIKSEIDPFSRQEIAKIVDAATGIERLMLLFSFHTGLRPSELLGLYWSAIDWQGFANIYQVQTEASAELEEPKTSSSIRAVKLNAIALDALKQAKQITRLQNQAVFMNPRTKKPFNGDQMLRRLFKRTCLKAGVRYRHPYQMRHSYASTSLMSGESPSFISAQLGHKTIDFTLKTYTRYIADNDPSAGSKFEEFMRQQ